MTSSMPTTNPYVGPRTFSYEQRDLFFGREREARDLLARVLSERLLLFYAQSGAGKSSLLHTRLIPQLEEEKGFVVLPVARVSGELPAGVDRVDNIFAYNLMLSVVDDCDPALLAGVTISDFLARLALRTVVDDDGGERKTWLYDAAQTPAVGGAQRYALIVDQFEEIITAHPGRWHEREAFFRQLDAAILADPNLWVVLTLREDYVAALDPYAPLLADRLRARFLMEHMKTEAALDAIRKPAELAGRPFAPGVAEKLVNDLRQIRVAGQENTVAGEYVEPVQLEVVCYQLWENLGRGAGGTHETEGTQITLADLAEAGDVDRALTQFYEETLAVVLADPAAAGVSERQLRTWFDQELITTAGTRGLVHQGEADTGGLPNGVVNALQRSFLVRAETRGGNAWIELVHDRFVEPIRANNASWFPMHLSTLQRQAALWDEQGRSSGLLLRDAALAEAELWVAAQDGTLEPREQEFLEACRAAKRTTERERQQDRRIRILALVALGVATIAVIAAVFGIRGQREAVQQKALASTRAAEAQVAEQRARVGELSAEAQLQANEFPQRSLLLAVEALRGAQAIGQDDRPVGEQALRDALSGVGGHVLTGHSAWIENVTFSPDARWLVTAGFDRSILLWRLDDTTYPDQPVVVKTLNEDPSTDHVLFTNDMKRLITVTDRNMIQVWDISSGITATTPITLSTEISHFPFEAAVSPDSRWLAVERSEPQGILLWDLNTEDVAASRIEILGYSQNLNPIAFGAGSRWLISSEWFGATRITDLSGPDPGTRTVEVPDQKGSSAVSPDGQWLATQPDDGKVRLLFLGSDDPLQNSFEFDSEHGQLDSFQFSGDGHWLAGATLGGSILLWQLDETGPVNASPTILAQEVGNFAMLSFSPDSRWLAVNCEGTIQLWSLSSEGNSHLQYDLRYEGDYESVHFSPDNLWLAASGDNAIHLWNLERMADSQSEILLRGFDTERLDRIEFSPDGEWLAASSGGRIPPGYNDGTVRLWNLAERDFSVEPMVVQAHAGPITKALLDPNRRQLITGGGDQDTSVRVWDIESLQPDSVPRLLAELEGNADVLAMSPDSRWLLTYGAYNPEIYDYLPAALRLWDLSLDGPGSQEPAVLIENPSNLTDVVFSDDGQRFVTLGQEPTLWDIGEEGKDIQSIALKGHNGPVWSAAFSHDGRWLITGGDDYTVRAWDLKAMDTNDQSSVLVGSLDYDIGAIRVSPDDKWVVVGEAYGWQCDHCAVTAWSLSEAGADPDTKARLGEHRGPIHEILMTSDSQRAITVSDDGTARIWELQEPAHAGSSLELLGHRGPIKAAALSADDHWLVTGSEDGTARIWDLAAEDPNQRSVSLRGHSGPVTAVMIEPDNEAVITTGADGTIRLWSMDASGLIDTACKVVGRNLKEQEWQRYFPDEAYRRTCENFPGDATSLLEDGRNLAKKGDLTGAKARFEDALARDPSLPIDPEVEAQRVHVQALVEEAINWAQQGDISIALTKVDEALARDPSLDKSTQARESWKSLCWYGALWNQAARVIDVCETAVRLAPNDFRVLDSRGLARALTGDTAGAIADFEFAVRWAESSNFHQDFVDSRQAWIAELKAGKNPFDEATLQALRSE